MLRAAIFTQSAKINDRGDIVRWHDSADNRHHGLALVRAPGVVKQITRDMLLLRLVEDAVDLARRVSNSGAVSVLLGNGDGTFQVAWNFSAPN